MKLTTAIRSAMAQTLASQLSQGSADLPKIEIYSGTMPATVGGTITGSLLGTLECAATIGTVSGAVLTFDAITDDSAADADGVAGWARLLDRDGAESAYFTVGEAGSGADLIMEDTALIAGLPISISSAQISVGQ